MNEEYKDLNPAEDELDKLEEANIWKEIAKIEGVSEYFRLLLSRDMRTYFNTPKEQQDLVKGAFYRTEYFSKLLKKNNSVDTK